MKDSALSLANYFVELSKSKGARLTPLRLMKLVYIAHGYMLALLDKTVINSRFDKIEAWKLGPVIPSVYHSFKSYGNKPIQKMTSIFNDETIKDGDVMVSIITPVLSDKDAQNICDMVWDEYAEYTDGQLVELLHRKGSPWKEVYVQGHNNEIPDMLTKAYYADFLKDRVAELEDELTVSDYMSLIKAPLMAGENCSIKWFDD